MCPRNFALYKYDRSWRGKVSTSREELGLKGHVKEISKDKVKGGTLVKAGGHAMVMRNKHTVIETSYELKKVVEVDLHNPKPEHQKIAKRILKMLADSSTKYYKILWDTFR